MGYKIKKNKKKRKREGGNIKRVFTDEGEGSNPSNSLNLNLV